MSKNYFEQGHLLFATGTKSMCVLSIYFGLLLSKDQYSLNHCRNWMKVFFGGTLFQKWIFELYLLLQSIISTQMMIFPLINVTSCSQWSFKWYAFGHRGEPKRCHQAGEQRSTRVYSSKIVRHVHTHTHTLMHTHAHTYIYIHTYIRTYIPTYMIPVCLFHIHIEDYNNERDVLISFIVRSDSFWMSAVYWLGLYGPLLHDRREIHRDNVDGDSK